MPPRSPALRVVRRLEPGNATKSARPALRALPSDTAETRTLDALYERYAPYIAAIATRILGRESEVEDVVQDVFASAVRGLRRRENDREIKSWLAKVTVRRSIQVVRLRRLWNLFDLGEDASYESLADPGASPEERQLVAEVYTVLDSLPPRQRVPWTLRYVEGQSLDEVARLCGCSLATVKRRINRAHARVCFRLHGGRP